MDIEEKRALLIEANYMISCEYDSHSYAFQGMVTSPNGVVQVISNWHYVPKEDSRKNNFEPFKQSAMNEAIEKAYPYCADMKLLAELRAIATRYLEAEEFIDQDTMLMNSGVLRLIVADMLARKG